MREKIKPLSYRNGSRSSLSPTVVPGLWLPQGDDATRVPLGAHPSVLPLPLSTLGCPSDPDLSFLTHKDWLLVPKMSLSPRWPGPSRSIPVMPAACRPGSSPGYKYPCVT